MGKITHEILAEKFRKAMGNRIPIPARDSWADFIRSKGTRFCARYEWIQDNRFHSWVWSNRDELEIEDGTEAFAVSIYEPPN